MEIINPVDADAALFGRPIDEQPAIGPSTDQPTKSNLPPHNNEASPETDWSHIIQLAWQHVGSKQDDQQEDLLPINKFLELVDILEEMLSLPSGAILAPSARDDAQKFMSANTQLEISRHDFETLLRDLSGDKMESTLPGIQRVSEAYSQLLAEPDVSVFFDGTGKPALFNQPKQLPPPQQRNNEKSDENNNNNNNNTINETSSTDNEDYDYLKPTNHGNPLHTSTPLHPKYPYANDLNKAVTIANPIAKSQFKRPIKKFGKDRRAISLGPYANTKNPAFDQENEHELLATAANDENLISLGSDHPWKVPTSPRLHHQRSHKDMRLIQEQEEQLQYYEHNASLLDGQRVELQSKLTVCQQQLKELQENDSRRLQHIEEIEHELETTQNELHERRMKQNEELRKAREAAAALEERLARGEDNNTTVKAKRKPSSMLLDDGEDDNNHSENNDDKTIMSPRLGSPLLASTPAPASGVPAEDWSDVSIRLNKLEEEKKSYQDVLNSMEKERTVYLSVIDELKNQLTNLQTEIVSLKASTDEHHQQLQQQATSALTHALNSDGGSDGGHDNVLSREDSFNNMMELAPDSIFQKIIPMIAEQRLYIKELLDGTNGNGEGTTSDSDSAISDENSKKASDIALLSSSTSLLSSRTVSVAVGAVGLCILGALLSDILLGNSNGSIGHVPDILWWQRYGSTIESWGTMLDSWVRPKNQHIPS